MGTDRWVGWDHRNLDSTRPAAWVIGAAGRVGQALMEAGAQRDWGMLGLPKKPTADHRLSLDVTDRDATSLALNNPMFSLVFLPAAVTDVDSCEDPENWAVNVEGVKNVVDAGRGKLIFFSTDYVFGDDGEFAESDVVHPLSQYGSQKVCAENYILANCPHALIVRTSWVFGHDRNFVSWVAHTLMKGEKVTVAAEEMGNPTFAPVLAEAVLDLVTMGAEGIWHVAGRSISRLDFAREIGALFSQDVEGVVEGEVTQRARRPLRSSLSVAKCERALGRSVDWTKGAESLRYSGRAFDTFE